MVLRTVVLAAAPLIAAGCGGLPILTHRPADPRSGRPVGVSSVRGDDASPFHVVAAPPSSSPEGGDRSDVREGRSGIRVVSAQESDLGGTIGSPSGGPEGTGGELGSPGEGTGGELRSPSEGTGGELGNREDASPARDRSGIAGERPEDMEADPGGAAGGIGGTGGAAGGAGGGTVGGTRGGASGSAGGGGGTGGSGAAGPGVAGPGVAGPGVADPEDLAEDAEEEAEEATTGPALELGEVLNSVYASYPLLEAAFRQRDVAFGNTVSSQGAFDTKLKGATENQPLGFYESYRHRIAVEQPLFGGGEVFGQYRLGRGFFEPWYKERQTDDGGEFRAGVLVPLLRGQEIDERRADLFRANLSRGAVEPEIRERLLEFSRAAAYSYWDWVAAGRNLRVEEALFENADERMEGLRGRERAGAVEPIALVDNERLIVSRRARVIDARRKLGEAAVKLSLFYRDPLGQPVVPDEGRLPKDLPEPDAVPTGTDAEIERAWSVRPELQSLTFQRRQLAVDLRQANNEMLPEFDAGLVGSQDVGASASRTRDKSEFELEAGLTLDVPLQRRKARGKIAATEGKIAQLNAKARFTRDKVAAEVRAAAVALNAAAEQYRQAVRSLELTRQLEAAELRRFELGGSDLFLVNAREQQTAEAAKLVIDAAYEYHVALADYCAALGELPPASSGNGSGPDLAPVAPPEPAP